MLNSSSLSESVVLLQGLWKKKENRYGKVEACLDLRCSNTFFSLCFFGSWQKTRETYGKEPWECEEEELAEILVSSGPDT